MNEAQRKAADKLLKKVRDALCNYECRMPALLGVKNLSRSDYEILEDWLSNESFRSSAVILGREVVEVIRKAGLAGLIAK